MDRCDILIVGGGPAGSSCAWALRTSGLDVLVWDKAVFPRDKVCAGWITPAVITDLALDVDDYMQTRVLQPIHEFQVARMAGRTVTSRYDRPVSYGIRRCEFDDYLLRRSGARLQLGASIDEIARDGDGWLINGALHARLLVGAGGHFCPVAKWLGAQFGRGERSVMAQECELKLSAVEQAQTRVAPGVPRLYFCNDLKGYGWCMRKGDYLNVGLGREDNRGLAGHVETFVNSLVESGHLPAGLDTRMHGHAYLCYPNSHRRLVDDGVLLVGDAAGLAYGQSGEGIRPAIESGLLAAEVIRNARGCYDRTRLGGYAQRLRDRFGPRRTPEWLPAGLKTRLADRVLASPWFVRHVVLDRWFLHRAVPALTLSA